MYLAMSRQADREGYPEIAEAFMRYAWEEAEHAAKFAELIGECVWDTKTNVEKRMLAEQGACEDKKRIATLAKQQNLMRSMIQSMRCARTRLVTVQDSRDFTTDISNRSAVYKPEGAVFTVTPAATPSEPRHPLAGDGMSL